jgi:spore protease
MIKRTDLAMEAKEMWDEQAAEKTKLEGVEASTEQKNGYSVTTVRVLDERGEKELCKPIGTYVTVELDAYIRREESAFLHGAETLATELRSVLKLKNNESVLVAALGNPAITPDSIGPKTARATMVTRHLTEQAPEHFAGWRQVSVLETGVLGTTGMETAELIKAVCEKLRPDRIIAVDALASRRVSRVCRTVQIADTGIVPGSGVGNSRGAVNKDSIGVPVIAVGVPTVVDAATMASDLAESAGVAELDDEKLRDAAEGMIVTPKEIDVRSGDISKLVAYGINMALHEGLTIEDIDMFVG